MLGFTKQGKKGSFFAALGREILSGERSGKVSRERRQRKEEEYIYIEREREKER